MPRVASHRRRPAGIGLAIVVLFACLWGGGRTVHAQQQGQLFLSVLDASGNPVTDLEPGDVSVMVDDVDCRIVKLEPISKPMKVTLMIDNGSGDDQRALQPAHGGQGLPRSDSHGRRDRDVDDRSAAALPGEVHHRSREADQGGRSAGARHRRRAVLRRAGGSRQACREGQDRLPARVRGAGVGRRPQQRGDGPGVPEAPSDDHPEARSPCTSSSCSTAAAIAWARSPARCRPKSAWRSRS